MEGKARFVFSVVITAILALPAARSVTLRRGALIERTA